MNKAVDITLILSSLLLVAGGQITVTADEPRSYPVSTLPKRATTPVDDHWSFQPIKRPPLPVVRQREWAMNPIDLFILARCEQEKIRPMPLASRQTLVRRVFLDIVGLPPTPNQVDRFLQSKNPDAYERLVDQLLASPHFGEKRGQNWLDLARFAETDGFEHDKIRKNAWKYRDWVIAAFNADLPYDQFLSLQLAGDEIGVNSEAATATGFCLSGPDMPDINSQEERRQNVLNELTGTVGSAVLGLQLACAQCHDHKYDPISQRDFYQMRAIFEPAVSVKKNQSLTLLGEQKSSAAASYLMIRGDWQRRGAEVQPNTPEVLTLDNKFQPLKMQASTGRRAGLAQWVTAKRNPLTARVIVNRIWQYHFGAGLVSTPSDFGLMGEAPSHPELLDWLAVELVENDWSLKHLSRLILTSATYRQKGFQAGTEPPADPALLASFPRIRLSGEVIRDSMLSVSNSINHDMGGPGVMPPIPEEMKRTLLKNQWVTSRSQSDHFRKSIYVFARRNLRYPIFEVFDRPDGNQSCPRRNQSTTAPQSLHLLNSELSLEISRRLAGDVLRTNSNLKEAIVKIFRRILARRPSESELKLLQGFVENQKKKLIESGYFKLSAPIPSPESIDSESAAALTQLCLALFNTNEFIYVD